MDDPQSITLTTQKSMDTPGIKGHPSTISEHEMNNNKYYGADTASQVHTEDEKTRVLQKTHVPL